MARKLYEKIYTLTIPAGNTSAIATCAFPHEALIKKVAAVRTANGSTPRDFKLDIYNKLASIGAATDTLAKVMPTSAASSSGALSQLSSALGYMFVNMEGTPAVPVRRLYIKATLQGTAPDNTDDAATVLSIAIGCEPVQGM
jgi:hypothetical protein